MINRPWLTVIRPIIVRTLTVLILVVLVILVGTLAIVLANGSPFDAFQELIVGAIGTRSNIAATLTRCIPIAICGLAAGLGFKAGVFNLGLEGQMTIGGLMAAFLANAFRTLPASLLLPLVMAGGCIAGAIWALPPAWWQTRFKVPLLLTTLLLNYIAAFLTSYLVNYPLRDLSGGAAVPQTVMIPEGIRLGILLPGTRLHSGALFIVLLPFLVAVFFRRTSLGYKMRMSGYNAGFAEYGGIDVRRITLLSMFLSGAIAGLAGVIQVIGVDFRYIDGVYSTPGIAWTGFIAAILALSNPYVIVVTGLFLAALKVGAAGMQRNTQLPLQIADVMQAAIIFVVAIRLKVGELVKRALPGS